MKIAVFGGTFDPFTIAHAEIVKQVASYDDIDKVIILPSIVNYHRTGKKPWLNLDHRLDVINKFVKYINSPKVIVDDMEYKLLKQNGINGTVEDRRYIDMLKDIRTKYYEPGIQIVTVIGTDSFINFKNWSRYTEILNLSSLIVVDGREGVYLSGNAGKAYVDLINELEHCIDRVIQFEGEVEYVAGLRKMSASAVRNSYQEMQNGFEVYCEWIDKLIEESQGSPESSLLLHTPIFDVVKGPEVQPGFNPVQIKAPDWVMVIAEKNDKLLAVSQLRYGNMQKVREFVCGQVEPGEDPRVAAMRELREETGVDVLDATNLRLIGAVNPNPAIFSNTARVYYVNLNKINYLPGQQELDEHEDLKIEWCDKYDLFDEFYDQMIHPERSALPALYVCAMGFYNVYKNRENRPY